MGNSRKFTVRLLTKLDENSTYSNIALDEALRRSDLTPQEKKFASALFYGTLERRLTLDAVIADLSRDPSSKINHTVRNILRTAIYQLCYMDSVPDSAAVDEAVKLAKKNRNPAVPGFVNGLLREFIRRDKTIPLPKDPDERLSIEYSCPVWLVKKWKSEYGEDACLAMLRSSLGRAPATLRVNSLKTDAAGLMTALQVEGLTCGKVPGFPWAVNVGFSGGVEDRKAYKDGLFHVQDISCQLCCAALDPRAGQTVLDMCASPGGKTFTCAELMEDKGRIMAFDLHPNRVKLIEQGAARLGISCITASVNNAKLFDRELPQAERVLCDVPCSGLGVIRRKPEIKYKSPTELQRLPKIQYDILSTSSAYTDLGGRLIYSTCTLSREENDEVADRFLASHPDFKPAPLGDAFGRFADQSRISVTPELWGSDGFFIAAFIRRR